MAKKEKHYDASDLRSLGDLEAMRKRPGMYIGSTEDPRQLFIEDTDNHIDEEIEGHSKKTIIRYDTKTGKVETRDFGRGIPIGLVEYADSITGKSQKIEALQLLFMKSHSGGKFDEGKAYRFSRGLHGLGNKIICALSSDARAITYRDGKAVELKMSKGKKKKLNYIDSTKEPNGTYVEFTPDEEIFDTVKIPLNVLHELSSIPVAFGLHIDLFIDGILQESKYHNLFDLLPTREDTHEYLRLELTESSKTEPVAKIVIAARYTSGLDFTYKGYTNMLSNSAGGSHIRFVESIWKDAWEKYRNDDFRPEDTLIGLQAVIGVSVANSVLAFSSQTKEKLTTQAKYFEHFRKPLIRQIQKFLDSHEDERKGLIKRFSEYRSSRDKMLESKELSSLIFINEKSDDGKIRRVSVVSKLKECTSKELDKRILYVVEGDSAGGTYIAVRDVRYHAVLPLRGKTLNISNHAHDLLRCMKNKEVASLVNGAGTGIGENCDASRSRYGRYYLSPDSDADGLHIACLMISVFVNLLPDVVKKGMVYIVKAPLYGWTDSRNIRHYTDDLSDVKDLSTLTRYKGLGEFDEDELYETCVKNPRLIQVTYPEDLDAFNHFMSSPEAKYKLLEERGKILTYM